MVPERSQIFKCELGGEKGCESCGTKAGKGCDLIIEVIQGCGTDCDIVCCDKQMELLSAKTADQGKEKHVPVIEKVEGGYKVKVGEVPHPMEADHWIQWIELHAGKKVYREYLDPGQKPEAVFKIDATDVCAREHCNKHGLWKGK